MQGYEPFLFRAVALNDLEAIYGFAKADGLTNLPPDRLLLEANIHDSLRSFSTDIKHPRPDDLYFFVMENIHTQEVIGCCAIYADIGTSPPFYTFKWDREKPNAHLTLTTEVKEVSEIGALYLSPKHRMHHLGAFLSRARFLFIASHTRRLHDTVVAEMRGRLDRKGRSPFWEGVAHHFITDRNFAEADLLVAAHQNAFIQEMIPPAPIPIDQINRRARACMGIPHKTTRAAVILLQHEGFIETRYLNVFDGGPLLIAHTGGIKTVQHSSVFTFAGTEPHLTQTPYLIGTTGFPFLAALGNAVLDHEKRSCYLTPEVAQKLNLTINDTLRLSPF